MERWLLDVGLPGPSGAVRHPADVGLPGPDGANRVLFRCGARLTLGCVALVEQWENTSGIELPVSAGAGGHPSDFGLTPDVRDHELGE
eukprot:1156458-Pelagomonas_calceolata.AAC.9